MFRFPITKVVQALNMLESQTTGKYKKVFEREFVHKFGVMLIKPDAINLGVEDYIVGRLTQELNESKAGSLQGVYAVGIKKEDIPIIYPSLPKEEYAVVENYLNEGPNLLLTFSGPGKTNLQESINKIKGKRLGDWSIEELDGANGFGNSLRGMLPVPGTIQQFEPVIKRIKLKKIDPSIRFSDAEYRIYCRNLVHSPDNLFEAVGLLRLLSLDQLSEIFSPKQYMLFNLLIRSKSDEDL